MELLKKYWFALVLIASVFLFAIFWLDECSNPNDIIHSSTDTLYIHDTVIYTVDIPKPFPVEVIVPDSITDTLYLDNPDLCCFELFSKKIYIDTIANDSNLLAVLRDTVFKNSLSQRNLQYQIKRPQTAIINNYNVYNNNGFYPGINLFIADGVSLGGSVLYAKEKNVFGLGFSPNKNNNIIFISINRKLF